MTSQPDYQQALRQALAGVSPLERIETVDLSDAGDRVLAAPIIADRDLPPFNRAQMDGYALRAAEFSQMKSWRVAGTISAGSSPIVSVPPGHCVAIATGAALPVELDTVVQHELSDRGDRAGKPVTFSIDSIAPGHAVHHRGTDAKAGQTLVESGTILQSQHIGIAAAVGATHLQVRARPRVFVLTSGDEVVPPSQTTSELKQHQIRNSNGPMMSELLRRMGVETIGVKHVKDESELTIVALREALAGGDVVVTVGGVSAGDRDYFPAAFQSCGVQMKLRGAAIQPGRPIGIGFAPGGQVVIALPGNPVSSLACACLFIWPIVRAMLGLDPSLPWRTVELSEPVKPNQNRRAFRPAIMMSDGKVKVPAWAGSGDLAHTAATHGLLELPVQADSVSAGTFLRFLPWP